MGMFDYIRCEMPLPEGPQPPADTHFQTKDTFDQYMTVFTITEDGKLQWLPYVMEEVPKAERPYPDDEGLLGLCGCVRRVEKEPRTVDMHGDIIFYHLAKDREWWEYRARFTDGRCVWIKLEEHTPPEPA